MSGSALTAVVALFVGGTLLWFGRHDLTRPVVAFGVPWFGSVALAQLRLTDLEQPWGTGFALVALGGGLAFVVAALLAGGTAGARGRVIVDRAVLRERRLVIAALVLIAGGAVGAAYKAQQLGGVPLFADDPDAVRGRALGAGRVDLPSWSSALTNGFYLSMWCALAALWVGRATRTPARSAALWAIAAVGLLGVSLEASRNVILFALVVPAVAAYVVGPRRGYARGFAWIAASICVLALGVGGLFVLRLARGDETAHTYIQAEMDRQSPAVRPVLPAYVNAVFPLEAARRLYQSVPQYLPYGLGANSLTSLPAAAFPEGKPYFGGNVIALMQTGESEHVSWAVATYQGRLLADLGWQGVVLGSLLLGLAFGALYRWARRRTGFVAVAVIGYVAYYSAYMLYDNLLSFTVIAVYDLALITVIAAYCTGTLDAPVRALARSVRQRVAS